MYNVQRMNLSGLEYIPENIARYPPILGIINHLGDV
jgi:hypothetical protein